MNRCNVIYFPIVAIAIKEPVYTNYASNDLFVCVVCLHMYVGIKCPHFEGIFKSQNVVLVSGLQ